MADRLHWICQKPKCNYTTPIGTPGYGIKAYRTHAKRYHSDESLVPSHEMLTEAARNTKYLAFKKEDTAQRKRDKQAKPDPPRAPTAIAAGSASSSRPQPHGQYTGQPQRQLPAPPQTHPHPTGDLQPRLPLRPHPPAAQVTPDQHHQSTMHASGNTYPRDLLATDIQGGKHHCELAACGKRYISAKSAQKCSDWHLATGYMAHEYPPGYSLAQNGAPLVHNAEWPLYHEIKGPGDNGNYTCTYPKCGRRYTRYNSAYLCMRWHQHTRRQVKEIVGHYPDAPLPALLIDTPKASRGVAGYYACDHKMVACDRAYMSHLFAQWCQDWHQATNERYPVTAEDWTRLRNRGQLPPNY